MERQQGKGANRRHGGEHPAESCDILKHLLPAAVTSSQDGEQAACEGLASEQEATERRRSVSELKHNSSLSALQRPLDELPRLNFQIPRKNKERKVLLQSLSQGSRELEDIMKILSSCYRDASSSGTFSYTKARLVHSELLEKDFVEKRRELKQDGRTDKELMESYCFLLPDQSKLHWICEKGLSVGHVRITTLGNPAMGVYLSKYSDLLQINPFDLGATGDIIIFKVMKGKVKSIYENMSKNLLDPTPKFDCHISKNATRVTSLLSYRAFELTQQYFYEYSFDEIKCRPRHVCPHAVVSFLYKGKEATPPPKPAAALRSNCSLLEGNQAANSYTIWSGQLLSGGKVVYQVGLRSSTRPFLPFKLPEKLEIGMVMTLDQVKRKIPAVLFSWDTYSGTREVLKSGMYCSLFEVVDKSKHGNSLTALLHKLERERMVLVNPLPDKGFLFLLSSAQMVNPNERRVGWTRCLQALFVFQEPRGVTKLSSKRPTSDEPLQVNPHPIMPQLDTFLPALHYALMKVRANPSVDLAAGVERQARDYLSGQDDGKVRPYYMNEYKQNLDEREKLHPAPKQKQHLEGYLRSYIYRPNVYMLPVEKAREMVESTRRPPEYSPISDWEGSDGQPSEHKGAAGVAPAAAGAQANGAPLSQFVDTPEKMRELMKLIQMSKKTEGESRHVGEGRGREARGLKRKLEEEEETAATALKYLKRASLDNGGHGRDEEGQMPPSLSAMMDCMGLREKDLKDSNATSRLMEMLATFSTVKKSSSGSVVVPEGPSSPVGPGTGTGGGSVAGDGPEVTDVPCYDTMIKLGLPAHCDIGLRNRAEEEGQDDLEDQTAGSMSSLEVFSPCSSNDQHRGTEILGEGQMPWFLIPITGIKSERYCLREEDNPQDPRFVQSPATSNLNTPEKSHTSLSEPMDDNCISTEGEGVEEEVREEVEDDDDVVLLEGSGPSRLPDPGATPCTLDDILCKELGHFLVRMQEILQEERVRGGLQPTPVVAQRLWAPGVIFSEYITHYTTPVSVHSYVTALCEMMHKLICPEGAHIPPLVPSSGHGFDPAHGPAHACTPALTPLPVPTDGPAHTHGPAHSLTPASLPAVSRSSVSAPAPALLPTPVFAPAPAPLAPAPAPAAAPSSSSPCAAPPAAKPLASLPHKQPPHSLPRLGTVKEVERATKGQGGPRRVEVDSRRPPRKEGGAPSLARWGTEPEPDRKHCTPLSLGDSAPGPAPTPAPPTSISSLISQLKPEVFSSLVEIIKDVQKNAVKFYVHSQEQESDVCLEIKEYLIRLGNVDCNPQVFLESQNNLDKLLIIIENEDIAAHLHTIPALVSLKKLPSVSFAGVDSLDDVKNHTYNELFVSGGFIVSDEFVLNPDFINHERLQEFLRFLEERSSPECLWQWKVHCKTQKKLKELGRLNSDTLSLLNLLTTYQKRHLVEFLPYHECDSPSRHAPDLECLIRLQAHHTQHRHIIFLTERRFEMFPHFSSNGIVIASIDDVLNSFHSLIGFHDNEEKPPASDNCPCPAPPAVIKNQCVDEVDMSLDSEDSDSAVIEESGAQQQGGAEDVALGLQPPLPPQNMEFLPSSSSSSSSGEAPKRLDFEALKSAISHLKASRQRPPLDFEVGDWSPGAFNVNPHQSFLCPATRTSSVTGYPGSPSGVHLGPVLGPPLHLQLSLGPEAPAPSLSAPGLGRPQDQMGGRNQDLVVTATMGTWGTVAEAGGQHGWAHLGTGGVSSPTSQDNVALLTPAPLLEPHRGKPPTPGSGNSASGTLNSRGGTMPGPARGRAMPGPAQGRATPSHIQGGTTPSHAQGGTTPSHAQGGTTPGHAQGGTTPGHAQEGTMPGPAQGRATTGHAQGGITPGPAQGRAAPSPAQGGITPGPVQGRAGPAQGGTMPGPTQGGITPGHAQGRITPGLAQGRAAPGPAQGGTMPGHAQGGITPGLAQGRAAPGPAQGRAAPGPAQGRAAPGPAQGRAAPGYAQGRAAPGPAQGGITPGPAQGRATPGHAQGGTMPGPAQGGAMPGHAQGGTTHSHAQGGAKMGSNLTGGSSTPSRQGSLNPVPPNGPAKAVEKTLARGGSSGGLLPFPQGGGNINSRGRGGPHAPFEVPRGNRAGTVAVGYRGLPPSRSRPWGCCERGGAGPCIRGFPPHGVGVGVGVRVRGGGGGRGRGRGGYYTDFTQDTHLSWGGEEYRSRGCNSYRTHRAGYNGW